jgi:hypothetical protein
MEGFSYAAGVFAEYSTGTADLLSSAILGTG